MRGLALKAILAAVIAGSGLLVAAQADARDHWDKWDRWDHHHHFKHKHKHKHSHWRDRDDDRPRRVIVERDPIIVAPARQPVFLAPMAPAYGPSYGPPMDPSVNFNFSFPRR
jgi:hypothetical protein